MADPKKPPRKRLGFFDARDRLLHLQNTYRLQAFGGDNRQLDKMLAQFVRELAEVETPEPDEELEGAELDENEWRQAMAAERLRRDRNNR